MGELTYLWKINKNLSLQFDAQYIANPNQAINLDDAIIVGLRTAIGF
ncbi:MAG: carbohydrate porin [Balneolaceae bacterium]